jgi:hypothetical protein
MRIERIKNRQRQRRNTRILRFAQNDDVKLTTAKTTAKTTATAGLLLMMAMFGNEVKK